MKRSKRNRLEKSGWKVGTTQEFLDLSDQEMALIDMKQRLMQMVRDRRGKLKMTQEALAEQLQSSQSRVAKLEGRSPDVSLDLIVRALFAMGVSQRDLAKEISKG